MDHYSSYFSLIYPGWPLDQKHVFRREARQTDSRPHRDGLPKHLGYAFLRGARPGLFSRGGSGGRDRSDEGEPDGASDVGRQHRLRHGNGNRCKRRRQRRRRKSRAGDE